MRALTSKARRLQQLENAGVPIPSTFVMSSEEVMGLAADYTSGNIEAATTRFLSQTPSNFFPLALRTSYEIEDGQRGSYAGAFTSVIGVSDEPPNVREALCAILDEYSRVLQRAPGSKLELILQPQIQREVHGVLFTIDPDSGSDDFLAISTTEEHEDVTAGAKSLTAYVDKISRTSIWGNTHLSADAFTALLDGSDRAQKLFPESAVDIEFGILRQKVFFFQVRPVTAVLSDEDRWFHSSTVADIAPQYKCVFSRHRAKRHLIYSVFENNGHVRFPKSLIVSKRSLRRQPSLAGRGIRTANVLTTAQGVIAPQRKEDFRLVSLSEFDERQCPRDHVLITEAPVAAYSGHLLANRLELILEWTQGPLSGFNSGSIIHRSKDIEDCSSKLNTRALQALLEGMRQAFPGSVAEWIQDADGHIWIYDATLNTSSPLPSADVPKGVKVAVTSAQVAQLGKLRRYPMSVNGEDDYMDDALRAKIAEVVPQVAMGGAITIASDYPAIELAILSLLDDVKEFMVSDGSVLCHLALIAREKGKKFTISAE